MKAYYFFTDANKKIRNGDRQAILILTDTPLKACLRYLRELGKEGGGGQFSILVFKRKKVEGGLFF